MSVVEKASAKGWPIRGVMLDTARLTENLEYYEKLIPRLAGWGYNTIFVHFCDDEGCSILLENTPVLPTPGAFTPEEWAKLIEAARFCGMEVIPEVECLGHTGYLTRLEEHKDLREPPLDGIYWSISPTDPRSLQLVRGVIEEVDAIFRSPYIHIGMDEADIGGSPATADALKRSPKWSIFCDYLNAVHGIVRGLGRKTMAWGDHLLSEEKLADRADKEIVICNWLYGYDYSENYLGNSRYLLRKGFEVLGCPAGVWNGTLFCSNKDNFENVLGFTQSMDALRAEYGDRILGMVTTMWCPYRTLPAAAHAVMYYGAKVFNGELDEHLWLSQLAMEEFGLEEPAAAEFSEAMRLLFFGRRRTKIEVAMMPYDVETLDRAADRIVRFASDAVEKASRRACEILKGLSTTVASNHAEFDQWVVTAEMINRVSRFAETYHNQNPAGPIGSKRRGVSNDEELKLLRENLLSGLKEMENALTFWRRENEKCRMHLGLREEQAGHDQVFWDIKTGDHPLERLGLTAGFVRELAGGDV